MSWETLKFQNFCSSHLKGKWKKSFNLAFQECHTVFFVLSFLSRSTWHSENVTAKWNFYGTSDYVKVYLEKMSRAHSGAWCVRHIKVHLNAIKVKWRKILLWTVVKYWLEHFGWWDQLCVTTYMEWFPQHKANSRKLRALNRSSLVEIPKKPSKGKPWSEI